MGLERHYSFLYYSSYKIENSFISRNFPLWTENCRPSMLRLNLEKFKENTNPKADVSTNLIKTILCPHIMLQMEQQQLYTSNLFIKNQNYYRNRILKTAYNEYLFCCIFWSVKNRAIFWVDIKRANKKLRNATLLQVLITDSFTE